MSNSVITEISYHIVAPGVLSTEAGPIPCEAVFCYDNSDRNPSVYWGPNIRYAAAYYCTTFPSVESLSHFTPDYLARIRLRVGLESVDLDKKKIIKVTRTTTIQETVEEV